MISRRPCGYAGMRVGVKDSGKNHPPPVFTKLFGRLYPHTRSPAVGVFARSPVMHARRPRAYKALQRIVHLAAHSLCIAKCDSRTQRLSRDCDWRALGWAAISWIVLASSADAQLYETLRLCASELGGIEFKWTLFVEDKVSMQQMVRRAALTGVIAEGNA